MSEGHPEKDARRHEVHFQPVGCMDKISPGDYRSHYQATIGVEPQRAAALVDTLCA